MPKRKGTEKRKRNGMHKEVEHPAVDQRVIKALAHELRVEILDVLAERMASPNELAKILDEGLSQVSYHVKVLKDYECITLVKTEPRRGAVEHYYRATSDTLLSAERWRKLGGAARTTISAGQASDLFNDIADAVDDGNLADSHSQINRLLPALDAQGWKTVRAGIKRLAKDIEDEQRASKAREAKANGSGGQAKRYTVGLIAFANSQERSQKKRRARKTEAASSNRRGADFKPKMSKAKRGSNRNGSRRKAKTVAK